MKKSILTAKNPKLFLQFAGIVLFFGAITLTNTHPLSAQTQDSLHINLNKAIEMALSDAPTMRIADRDIQIKQWAKKETIAALFPSASIAGTYQRTLLKQQMAMDLGGQPMNIKVGKDNTYSAGLNISLPLIAPSLWSNVKLSQMDVEMAMESARSSKLEMVNQVKQAYYTYLFAKESYDVLQKNFKNMQDNNDLVTNMYKQGLVSEFEKLRSDVALQNQRPSVTQAEKAVRLSYQRLKVVLGMDINEPVIFDGDLTTYENDVLSATIPNAAEIELAQNTAMKQLELGIRELEQSKKIITGSSCPNLSFAGNLQYAGMGDSGTPFNNYPYSYIGLQLAVPITGWIGTSYKLKEADLNIANMRDQKQDLERNLRIGIQNSINEMQQAIEDLAADREAKQQAERAYNIAKKQYEVGMNTWLDLNAAELAMISAQLTYNQSLYNYLIAKATYDSTLGVE